jgi:hypothetical protein
MKSKIIGQGYNLDENTSAAKELIELFNSDKYDKFTCLVAFASYGGITALTPHILRAKENDVKIILQQMNMNGPEALMSTIMLDTGLAVPLGDGTAKSHLVQR